MKEPVTELQGEWEIVALEMDGVSQNSAVFSGSKIVIAGNRFTSLGMGAEYRGTIEMDGSVEPKTFCMRFSDGPEKGNTNFGIYELNGDSWKICLSTRGDRAPLKFATTKGSGFALEVLQRKAGTRSHTRGKHVPTS